VLLKVCFNLRTHDETIFLIFFINNILERMFVLCLSRSCACQLCDDDDDDDDDRVLQIGGGE